MKTETPEIVALEVKALDGWVAYGLMGRVVDAVGTLGRKAFHTVRKTRSELKRVFDHRENGIRDVVDNYVEKDERGEGKRTPNGQDFLWQKGKEVEGRAALFDVNNEIVTINIVPLLWDELLPPEAEGQEEGRVRDPNLLFMLEDLGIVAQGE